jgi:transposase InsO family protein
MLKHSLFKMIFTYLHHGLLGVLGKRLGRQGLELVASAAKPDTILAWFRKLVAQKFNGSRHRRYPGRPTIGREITELIASVARENSGWGYDRIAGALDNLGHHVSDQTVGNILRRFGIAPAPKRRQQMSWADFRVLFVFIVLEHDRRKVLHFNATEHPTGAWTAQQIVEAFADREAARYLIRDRDSRYSADVRLRIQSLGMQEILTAPRSPWQNPYAERLIGSIRRECLNHYIILNARHLKRTLSSYFRYYHESRTHLSLGKQCPFPREALSVGKIVAIPQLGGLHHRYERIAA